MIIKNYSTLLIYCVLVILLVAIQGYKSEYACPRYDTTMYKGYVPKGTLTAGNFTKVEVRSSHECVMTCCRDEQCNVVLMKDATCYHIICVSNDMCEPIKSTKPEVIEHVSMVLVKPVKKGGSWSEAYKDYGSQYHGDGHTQKETDEPVKFNKYLDDPSRPCNPESSKTCPPNEECIQISSDSGVCSCKKGYTRNSADKCVFSFTKNDYFISPGQENISVQNQSKDSSNVKHLTVSVISKEIRLPESEVSLSAFTVPVASEGEKYQYEWTLLSKPTGSDTIRNQNESSLQLSRLSEGLYTFKVTVTGEQGFGETYANLTVLPPKRINKPPQVIINPSAQTVKLPNTGAVLDASGTKDDNGIFSWHWELQEGPLGYQPHLEDKPTLLLDNLNIPGNYTFKVIVTDTDRATNYSTANITVLKITDYPPEANAGQDVIIYLPRNEVTLNGNMSTDDRTIVAWEWTKSSSDADKAVDMQDTRTPYLRLSHLEEGMYTFVLKVTDSSNQSSTSVVHVFVKPEMVHPLKANAGNNITISLPQTWAVLNGSNSKNSDEKLTFQWKQIDGPWKAVLGSANVSALNVTGLTKGLYNFMLTIKNYNGDQDSSTVSVLVTQNKNQRPKANGGGDQNILLPVNVIFINGSESTDDLAIAKWHWTRDNGSLAVGNIVNGSDHTSVLMLTNVVPGRYVFQLTVWDEQGLSDTDTVSVMIKEDQRMNQLVELVLEVDSRRMTEIQFRTLEAKLALLVKDGSKLHVRELRSEPNTGRVILVFYVETANGSPVIAKEVVSYLKQKLILDKTLLGYSVASLKTSICQNKCSGHGSCNEQSRNCLCEAFWMQDLFQLYLGDGEADCNWSVLYVVVGIFCTLFIFIGVCWSCTWLCMRTCSKHKMKRKPQNYSLIEDTDENVQFNSNKTSVLESDTDSDVLFLFESRNKPSLLLGNGMYKNRNNYLKLNGRLKT